MFSQLVIIDVEIFGNNCVDSFEMSNFQVDTPPIIRDKRN
jgi:hypothetical protein